jgi:TusA-related sulfurtransferase
LSEIGKIIFRTHAIIRMFQRHVDEKDVRSVLETGEIIEAYPDDTPYPSRLILGWVENKPLHVVTADNIADNETIVITVYEPDQDKWSLNFKRRIL